MVYSGALTSCFADRTVFVHVILKGEVYDARESTRRRVVPDIICEREYRHVKQFPVMMNDGVLSSSFIDRAAEGRHIAVGRWQVVLVE